ncbi:carbohydrate ABC transporter permease [Phototrophicus methaneseepsis]|uniref:Carbohydrate ABC transporter permease n=1 Tax=Phototrophicus methaneseepsis TaxID=2710758 RepID=A0A7S8EDY9_9CHLR|nr:carbohydrate ABC transporter permease [Phototrophicus methaneseepsis]QPC84968.1 carbohydrate ABC transporter permease [Phototrophicus methaneseepsis]
MAKTKSSNPNERSILSQIVLWLALILGALVMVFPIYWMIMTTIMPQSEAFSRSLILFPESPTLENFIEGWNNSPWPRWYANTFFIVITSVTGSVFMNLLAGYTFAKFEFRGRNVIFFSIIATLMIPLQVLLVPRFLIISSLGWVNSYWSVIGPHMAEPFGLFFMRQFMLDIPDELLEAARLDGAGEFTIFRKIVVPLAKPAIAVLVILGFSTRWNAFAWPLVALTKKEMLTVQLGINFMKGYYYTDWPAIIAMVLVSIIPIIVVFLAFQRYFIAGIARTGIK